VTSIGFIGGGRMAEAIIKGILSSKIVSGPDIHVSDVDVKRRDRLAATYAVSAEVNNQRTAELSDVIILAVKPQVINEVIKGLKIPREKLVISIAAGITLGFLEKNFPEVPVIRAMPNNPALAGAGITAIAGGKHVSPDALRITQDIFAATGEVIMVEEKDMDAVTGLSGSGPAYVYVMIEALIEAGEKLGLDKEAAKKLAVETVLGAAQTMKQTGKSARELREMVTSPGGTTMEGLKVLEKKKFKEALMEAVEAAARKSAKLSK
jgi:pyrroline-5-carboxylate reductase